MRTFHWTLAAVLTLLLVVPALAGMFEDLDGKEFYFVYKDGAGERSGFTYAKHMKQGDDALLSKYYLFQKGAGMTEVEFLRKRDEHTAKLTVKKGGKTTVLEAAGDGYAVSENGAKVKTIAKGDFDYVGLDAQGIYYHVAEGETKTFKIYCVLTGKIEEVEYNHEGTETIKHMNMDKPAQVFNVKKGGETMRIWVAPKTLEMLKMRNEGTKATGKRVLKKAIVKGFPAAAKNLP